MDDLVCEWCDAPFSRPSDMGPSPKFCSASHRQRAYEVRRIEGLVSDLTAERDRLRAVVDAARAYMESIDSTDPTITRQYRQECMAEVRRALRVLDESEVTGGCCPDCGNPDRYCDCPDRSGDMGGDT